MLKGLHLSWDSYWMFALISEIKVSLNVNDKFYLRKNSSYKEESAINILKIFLNLLYFLIAMFIRAGENFMQFL